MIPKSVTLFVSFHSLGFSVVPLSISTPRFVKHPNQRTTIFHGQRASILLCISFAPIDPSSHHLNSCPPKGLPPISLARDLRSSVARCQKNASCSSTLFFSPSLFAFALSLRFVSFPISYGGSSEFDYGSSTAQVRSSRVTYAVRY